MAACLTDTMETIGIFQPSCRGAGRRAGRRSAQSVWLGREVLSVDGWITCLLLHQRYLALAKAPGMEAVSRRRAGRMEMSVATFSWPRTWDMAIFIRPGQPAAARSFTIHGECQLPPLIRGQHISWHKCSARLSEVLEAIAPGYAFPASGLPHRRWVAGEMAVEAGISWQPRRF